MRILLIIFIFSLQILVSGQMPKQWNSGEIIQQLNKLGVLGNVLYLAAHPDDENTRFISYAANESLYNTGYLSITRGDGGQNLVGPEIREELGIIRTQELLAARRIDGGQQFFTRANDFGYSKTPEETLEIWDKSKVLADVVWVIRKFRPDLIICRFPADGRGGHGHHTSSALLADEAFEMAADPTKFPEQLKYVDVWKTKRLLLNTGRWWNDKISADDENVIAENIGVYNELLGTSYNEMAARSRTMHKSQGFGSTGSRGFHEEFFEYVKGNKSEKLFDNGSSANWLRVDGAAYIQDKVNAVIEHYEPRDPGAIVKELLLLRKDIAKINNEFWKEIKLREIDDLIVQCSGIYIEAKADDFSKTTGDSLFVEFEIIQRTSGLNIEIETISSSKLVYEYSVNKKLEPNKKEVITSKFIVPILPVSQPYWLKEKANLGTYNVNDQNLIGVPENGPAIKFKARLKFEEDIIEISFPLIYKKNDPVKGELYRPFIITPKITANLEQPIYLFSSIAPQKVIIKLTSNTNNQKGLLELKAPEGWNLAYDKEFTLEKKHQEVKVIATITASKEAKEGSLEVFINGEKSRALNTIDYDHIPTQVWFPDSDTKLVFVDIQKKGKKVAYLSGAGDVVPESLRNIGYEVDILEESDLVQDNLLGYDAILLGIRFLNINERADFIMPKLLKYCENGGNLIVQYNTAHRLKTEDFGPFPIELSRDRVTEEDAEVSFLLPNHPVLNEPNKITKADFDNWVQERGLYFPHEWDENYKAILSWHDTGEEPKSGSLLVAKYGKGNYVYTGISFFRELPAGVPGAYRLLVNILSLGNE
jgi:LmbE family N-acetylglucosaminyl deacetylase